MVGRRLAVNTFDRIHGWLSHPRREWIEFIIAAVLLWLLMMTAISELELRSVG